MSSREPGIIAQTVVRCCPQLPQEDGYAIRLAATVRPMDSRFVAQSSGKVPSHQPSDLRQHDHVLSHLGQTIRLSGPCEVVVPFFPFFGRISFCYLHRRSNNKSQHRFEAPSAVACSLKNTDPI
jgi:hypothetical protein